MVIYMGARNQIRYCICKTSHCIDNHAWIREKGLYHANTGWWIQLVNLGACTFFCFGSQPGYSHVGYILEKSKICTVAFFDNASTNQYTYWLTPFQGGNGHKTVIFIPLYTYLRLDCKRICVDDVFGKKRHLIVSGARKNVSLLWEMFRAMDTI